MQIIAPARTLQEAELLLISGVSLILVEFQAERSARGTQARTTQRRPENSAVTTMEEVRRMAECAHRYGAKAYLCADREAYSGRDIQAVVDMIKAACDPTEIDGIMTSNPCLVVGLREEKVSRDLMVGPEELVLNRQAVLFWNELGVTRIVLPSYLSTDDVESLVRNMQGIHFCAAVFRGYVSPGEPLPKENHAEDRMPLRSSVDSIEALFCSLCNMPKLWRAGISSVTVELHGEGCNAKIGLVTAVKALIDMVGKGSGDEEVEKAAREIMECEKLHRSGYLCLASGLRESNAPPLRLSY